MYGEYLQGTESYAVVFRELVEAWQRKMAQTLSNGQVTSTGRDLVKEKTKLVQDGWEDFTAWMAEQTSAPPQTTGTWGQLSGGEVGSHNFSKDNINPSIWHSLASPPDRSIEPINFLSQPSLLGAGQIHASGNPSTTMGYTTFGNFDLPILPTNGTMRLLGSPKATEAFTDQWGGKLGEMGERLGGGMREDYFS